MIGPMTEGRVNEQARQVERDVAANDAARRETLRRDGARSLGDNLEQADALIRAAFELAAGMPSARR
jgi:hypothetical protein